MGKCVPLVPMVLLKLAVKRSFTADELTGEHTGAVYSHFLCPTPTHHLYAASVSSAPSTRTATRRMTHASSE